MPSQTRSTDDDEYCPVCKSSRYLNPNIKFLIEPSCYHKMCGSCVDRLFSAGPAPCPVAGCTARLRSQRFRTQTFADVAVEREVDVRRRVTKIYNKRPEEFATAREWDDYLENIETVTFDLVSGTRAEREAAEQSLLEYEEANRDEIRRNAQRAQAERKAFAAREKALLEEKKVAREIARREVEAEAAEIEERKRRQLAAMEAGDQAAVEALAREFAERAVKRRKEGAAEAARARAMREGQELALESMMNAPIVEEQEEAEEEWAPLGKGVSDVNPYYTLQEEWPENAWVDEFVSQPQVSAGGYSKEEWYERNLFEAFAGLTCYTGDGEKKNGLEKVQRTDVVVVDAA